MGPLKCATTTAKSTSYFIISREISCKTIPLNHFSRSLKILKSQNLNKNKAESTADHKKTEKYCKNCSTSWRSAGCQHLGAVYFLFPFFSGFVLRQRSQSYCLPLTTPCRSRAAAAAAYRGLEADLHVVNGHLVPVKAGSSATQSGC